MPPLSAKNPAKRAHLALLALGVAGAYFFRRRAAGPDDLAVKGESTEIEEESKEQPATD